LSGKDEYEVYLYAYTGMYDKFLEFIPTLNLIDEDLRTLYYHLKTPLDVTVFLDPVSIDTVKKAEDSDDIIIRLYESKNMRTETKINFGFDVKKAHICDLMENDIEEIEVTENSVNLSVKPFEIITLKISR